MQFLTITKEQIQSMIDYVDSHAPLESCGLLAGRSSKVEKIFFVQNQAQSPVRFVMDPIQQLHAFEWMDDNGLELLAIFHSHPSGPETVSATDVAEAAYAVVQVVLSRKNEQWGARGFWVEKNGFNEVKLQVV